MKPAQLDSPGGHRRPPATNGQLLKIRKASTPEPVHREIYRTLQIPHEVMKPVRTWSDPNV